MNMRSVGFALRTDGKAEVKNDFREVQTAAEGAFDGLGAAADRAAERANKAAASIAEQSAKGFARVTTSAEQQGLNAPAPQTYATRGEASADLVNVKLAAALKGEMDPAWAATRKLNTELERLAQIERLGVLSTEELATAQGRARAAYAATIASLDTEAIAEERLAERRRAFLATIDPAVARQDRFNAEMAEARGLVARGAISLDEYCVKLRQTSGALNQTETAHSRMGASGAIMQHVVRSTGDSFAAGLPPMMIFTEQLGRVGEAAALSGAKEGALGAMASFMAGPWGIALTAAIAIGGTLAASLLEGGDAAEASAKAHDSLRDAVERLNGSQAALNHTTRQGITDDLNAAEASRQLEIRKRALLDVMLRSAQAEYQRARFAGSINVGSAGASAAAGGQASAALGAEQEVNDALKLNASRTLEATTAANVARGKLIAREAAGSTDAATAATQRYENTVDSLTRAHDRGRLSDDLYRQGLLNATATREAATKAAKDHGGASTALADAQGRLAAADTGVQRATAQLAITRATARAELKAGTITQAEYSDRIRQGTQAVEAARASAKEHAASLRESSKEAKVLAADMKALQDAFDPAAAAARNYHDALAKIAAVHLDPAKATEYAEAARAAFVKARAGAFELPSVEAMRPGYDAQDKAEKDRAAADKRREDAYKRTVGEQADALETGELELKLVRATTSEREAQLAKLRAMQTLRKDGIDATGKEGQEILGNADAIEANRQRLERMQADWDEARQSGERFVDDVLDPNNWSSWGDMGKKILDDLKQEFLKLALLNPIKNMLFGENNATLSGVFGSLFGGKSTTTAGASHEMSHNASGTNRWSGGETYVNENGGEIMDLPEGTRIYPAAESRRMMASNDNGGAAMRVKIDLNSDYLHATVDQRADERIGVAAPRIAAGGAALGGRQAARARRRQLGTR